MKVLCVTTCFPSKKKPFYCVYIYQQIKELIALGVDVDVLIPDKNIVENRMIDSFNEIKIYHFKFIETKWYKNPEKCNLSFKNNLEELLNQNNYDVIQFDIIPFSIVKIFNRFKRKNCIFSAHIHGLNIWNDYGLSCFKNYIQSSLKYRTYKKIDCYIGVSKLTSKMIEKRIPASKIYTVYNGVDSAIFYPAIRNNNDFFTIGIIANLIKIKGHEYLLEAFEKFIKDVGFDKKVILKIIGDGPEKNNIVSIVQRLDISNRVCLIDYLNYDDVASFLRTECDLFIMPSYFEALGCVYLEAMACKVLTVGVKGCGIDEIIVDKENGLLVRKQNSDDIYDAIKYAYFNKNSSELIAERGFKTVTQYFTWKKSAESLLRVYNNALERKNGKV